MKTITMLSAKIHRARNKKMTVTGAHLDYRGSITVCTQLMEAAGLFPNQLVHVNNFSNAAHWETYIIEGEEGQICLNGAPARLFAVGDEVVIMGFCQVDMADAYTHKPTLVFVDKSNHLLT